LSPEGLDHDRFVSRRQRKRNRFDLGFQEVFDRIGALLQKSALRDNRLAGDQLFQFGILAGDVKAFLFQAAAEYAVEHGGVDAAVFEGLHLNTLIADDLELDLVALVIKTEMLEPKHDSHPNRAADAGDTESFAAQIFGPFLIEARVTRS
jgi:hypothetical protein